MENEKSKAVVSMERPPEDTGKSLPDAPDTPAEAPARSRRPSFGAVRRQLTDEELKSPAVQKLLIDMLEDAEADRDDLKSYVDAFHSADKRSAVLAEQLSRDHAVEVFFGVGAGLGGVIFGLAPFFWDMEKLHGKICMALGILLIVGAAIGRAVKK